MSHAVDSKSAAAALIDPLSAPEPSAEDGPSGTGFRNTFAPATQNGSTSPSSTRSSNNPFRSGTGSTTKHSPSHRHGTPTKAGATTSVRSTSGGPRPEKFPAYRAEAFQDFESLPARDRASSHGTPPSYDEATSSKSQPLGRRRGSSLKERYPGDKSGEPLDIIRRDSRKAYRSVHKRSLPGADSIDRLDPAVGGRAYHHEGPYDAALMARNRNPKHAPLNAVKDSNAEAIRATPQENVKDAVERHKPLDGTAVVPPGERDRFGRRYNYHEGADMMHEASSGDPGYKRWTDRDYDPEDLKGESEPSFGLDRALRAHKISENNGAMELQDRASIDRDYHDAERRGTLDRRDPVDIAGGESKYADMEIAASASASDSHTKSHGLGSLKKRIGSLRKKERDD